MDGVKFGCHGWVFMYVLITTLLRIFEGFNFRNYRNFHKYKSEASLILTNGFWLATFFKTIIPCNFPLYGILNLCGCYCILLLQYVSTQSLDQIFSSNWKSREAGLQDLARDIVSLLMPSFTHHQPSNAERTHEQLQRSSVVRCALEACCPIIAYSCTDAVLKVYLATLVCGL